MALENKVVFLLCLALGAVSGNGQPVVSKLCKECEEGLVIDLSWQWPIDKQNEPLELTLTDVPSTTTTTLATCGPDQLSCTNYFPGVALAKRVMNRGRRRSPSNTVTLSLRLSPKHQEYRIVCKCKTGNGSVVNGNFRSNTPCELNNYGESNDVFEAGKTDPNRVKVNCSVIPVSPDHGCDTIEVKAGRHLKNRSDIYNNNKTLIDSLRLVYYNSNCKGCHKSILCEVEVGVEMTGVNTYRVLVTPIARANPHRRAIRDYTAVGMLGHTTTPVDDSPTLSASTKNEKHTESFRGDMTLGTILWVLMVVLVMLTAVSLFMCQVLRDQCYTKPQVSSTCPDPKCGQSEFESGSDSGRLSHDVRLSQRLGRYFQLVGETRSLLPLGPNTILSKV